MRAQTLHDMIARPTADEAARQDFVFSFRGHVLGQVMPGMRKTYEIQVAPKLRQKLGREPKSRHEIGDEMERQPYYQTASSLLRLCQEVMWDVYGEKIDRHLPELIDKARAYAASNRKLGSLMLDDRVVVPRYNTAVDIHIQPGGYHEEWTKDDVFAGALYDDAVWTFALGGGGGLLDVNGRCLAEYVKDRFPVLRPKRILDLGCTIGHSTVGVVDCFPEAEVYAIDVAAACLRYAHARAEAIGRKIHFSQQNAEATTFHDGHFDLIVSANLFHETSAKAMPRILKECHRLLRPGGVMIHADIAPKAMMGGVYDSYQSDWFTHYNAEPFISHLMDMDHAEACVQAGFAREKVDALFIPSLRANTPHAGAKRYVFLGQK